LKKAGNYVQNFEPAGQRHPQIMLVEHRMLLPVMTSGMH